MGAVLVRSAFSANIKERRDCSTALFDERGRLIAQAEHIPVHLGARPDGEVLARLVALMRNPDERRGDLRAQIAAHRLAERRVGELCERRGRDRVVAAMDELFAYSERAMRAGIVGLPDGRYEARDVL